MVSAERYLEAVEKRDLKTIILFYHYKFITLHNSHSTTLLNSSTDGLTNTIKECVIYRSTVEHIIEELTNDANYYNNLINDYINH